MKKGEILAAVITIMFLFTAILWKKDNITETNVDTYEDKRIALTFDDGPSPATTEKLLDGLKERNVKATFFIVGENAKENPDILKRIYDEGHLIGNHTYTHIDLTRVTKECALMEIEKNNDLIESITGYRPEYIRPPFGTTEDKYSYIEDMTVVLWNIDPFDWNTCNVDGIVNKVTKNAGDGDIILLHDIYDTSVEAAFRIIDELLEQEFTFVTVKEILID